MKIICQVPLFSFSTKKVIWKYHYKIGHPSFKILQCMFSFLFFNVNIENFTCETCEIVKHQHVVFRKSDFKSSAPYLIIHFDVWGSSKISNIFGTTIFANFINDCTQMI